MCPSSSLEAEASSMEPTMEFRLLMAYAQRRRPGVRLQAAAGLADKDMRPDPAAKDDKKRRRRRSWKKMSWKKLLPKCVRPEGESERVPGGSLLEERSLVQAAETRRDLNGVAEKLEEIVDSVQLCPAETESDGIEDEEDYAIQRVVELLRESGDKLDEEIKKDKVLSKAFQNLFGYAFFKSIADLFLMRTGASADLGSDQQRAKIALAAEMTSKLTAVDNHPMNQVLGFGAKYLQEHFTPWVQSQGGWEKAFDGTEDDNNDEVQ